MHCYFKPVIELVVAELVTELAVTEHVVAEPCRSVAEVSKYRSIEMFSSLEVAIMPFPSSASGNKMRSRAVPEVVAEFTVAEPAEASKHGY